jgi:hypothetical protein
MKSGACGRQYLEWSLGVFCIEEILFFSIKKGSLAPNFVYPRRGASSGPRKATC